MINRWTLTNKLLAGGTLALFIFVTILMFWLRASLQI